MFHRSRQTPGLLGMTILLVLVGVFVWSIIYVTRAQPRYEVPVVSISN